MKTAVGWILNVEWCKELKFELRHLLPTSDFTSMPKVTYLLAQEQTRREYKIHDVETSKFIASNNSEIQVLLDQAAMAVRDLVHVDPIQPTRHLHKFTLSKTFSFYTPSQIFVVGH